MHYFIAAHTDAGTKKKINQDSYMIKEAQTERGRVCLCVLCDGMGGLSKGELASAAVIRAFAKWFETQFPALLTEFTFEKLQIQWLQIAKAVNQRLVSHTARTGCRMGTTLVGLLLIENHYYIINVGDSRAYALLDRIYQLTKDQSLVQQQIDLGWLSPKQARMHPRRNVLLQCIGASEVVVPDFYEGTIFPGTLFLLCSDGFCHVVSEEEIYAQLSPDSLWDEQTMKERIIRLTELEKTRRETDNISAVAVKVVQEE